MLVFDLPTNPKTLKKMNKKNPKEKKDAEKP
jgi:hypothetical protein